MAEFFTPYEENHELIRLGLTVTVVSQGQAPAIEERLKKHECAIVVRTHGRGTSPSEFYEALGIDDGQKHILFGILRKDQWWGLRHELEERFRVSVYARGVSFFVPINAIAGVSIYKMLANKQTYDRIVKKKDRKEALAMNTVTNAVKREYVCVFAIVNNGYSDLVMNAARAGGARGGTIIKGRGTGNKDIEKFFGVVITPEKEIAMILIPAELSDTVMSNINKEAGIDSKGQGIVFAMPVDDVVGLADNGEAAK